MPRWSKRVGTLVQDALPVLGERIGLAWPRDDTLIVEESVSRSTGGYAGLFDPNSGLVEVAYYADDGVVLHEAAHGWFNGALLADRWSNEAFASYYGESVAKTLKVTATTNELTDALKKSAIPLNAWGPVGHEVAAIEDYGYAASLAVARAIAERAGDDGLRAVWQDAADRVGAYQPPIAASASTSAAQPELVAGSPDWRVLLDLLEARTPATYDDLWRTWIARDEDLPLLDERAAARVEYAAVVARAADWELPRPIRDAMRAWRFDEATALLDDAGDGARSAGRDQGRGRRRRARGAGGPARHLPGHGWVRRRPRRGRRRDRSDRALRGRGRCPTGRPRPRHASGPVGFDAGRRPGAGPDGLRRGRPRDDRAMRPTRHAPSGRPPATSARVVS